VKPDRAEFLGKQIYLALKNAAIKRAEELDISLDKDISPESFWKWFDSFVAEDIFDVDGNP